VATHLFQLAQNSFLQFWQFTIFSSFNFEGHFEGLNEGFLGKWGEIAKGIMIPQNESPR
jgi:hypothetical protein